MKKILNTLALFCFLITSGCGSKQETIGDKIDHNLKKAESEAKDLEKKTKTKSEELENKFKDKTAHKKEAPVEIAFELKENNQMIVTININKPVKNLVIQANPLDGLLIQPVSPSAKDFYEEPTVLKLPVTLNNKLGRLAIYVKGSFDGRQLAIGQSYDFPDSNASSKKAPTIEIDGNGTKIRTMPATEK